ncbi:hypothetical protein CQW23_12194 [Capsicum baccatum]|uniref:Uncharacterized protein n=1 Tax=Capsicum baccatum TaxID=33114 RepID=A0A2G2WRV7_CAPBA|nr:hypothetical protein CQW23_12194 [Capsicum baccatum]
MVNGAKKNENLGDEILEDFDTYWEDVNDRLMGDLLCIRYALLLWDYLSRKEKDKTQSDDKAPMRPPRKIGITEETEVHEI